MAAMVSSGMQYAAASFPVVSPRLLCKSVHNAASSQGQLFRGIACQRAFVGRQRPFTAVGRGKPVRCVAAGDSPMKVAVTGAGGRTGSLTVKRLLGEPNRYSVVAIVRRKETAAERLGDLPDNAAVAVVDIAAEGAEQELANAFAGANALVIASSAVPKMKQPPPQSGPPEFYYEQTPEQVDWLGQKAQIDAAKQAGVEKVVLIGSMGGTDESNRLNQLGNGKILVFKRKAEEYLIASGLNYTIIHPGGLFDENGGDREIVLGINDQLLKKAETEGTSRRIPRDDVAALAVAALTTKSADKRAVDAVAKEPGDGTPTTDFEALFAGLSGNCKY